jgi:hypothetical protein
MPMPDAHVQQLRELIEAVSIFARLPRRPKKRPLPRAQLQ